MNQSYIVWEAPTGIPLGCTGCLNISVKLSKQRKQRLGSVHRVPSMRLEEHYKSSSVQEKKGGLQRPIGNHGFFFLSRVTRMRYENER